MNKSSKYQWNKSRKLLDTELLVLEQLVGWGLVVYAFSKWIGV